MAEAGIAPPKATSALVTGILERLQRPPIELALVLYIDNLGRMAAVREVIGTKSTVDLPIRMIARDALHVDAVGVVMAHNHPSGDPEPSDADILFTRRLARGLDALGIDLKDHLVLAGEQVTSLRRRGVC